VSASSDSGGLAGASLSGDDDGCGGGEGGLRGRGVAARKRAAGVLGVGFIMAVGRQEVEQGTLVSARVPDKRMQTTN
jgi:hypothetical protein